MEKIIEAAVAMSVCACLAGGVWLSYKTWIYGEVPKKVSAPQAVSAPSNSYSPIIMPGTPDVKPANGLVPPPPPLS